jgi:Cu(I)/Ag(I) efflux system membrane fusion protein
MASLTLKNTALILGSMLIGGALTAALYTRLGADPLCRSGGRAAA